METSNYLEPVYVIVNPDDKKVLERYKQAELQERIRNYGGSVYSIIDPYELSNKIENGQIRIAENNLAGEGDVIFKTNGNTYHILRDKDTIDTILEGRIVAIQSVVNLLGGFHFKALNHFSINKNGEISTILSAGAKFTTSADRGSQPIDANGSLNAGYTSSDNIQFKEEVEQTANGVLTPETYQKAIEKANEYNLIKLGEYNTFIGELIEQRNPEHPNSVTRQTHSIELTFDIRREIDLGINLSVTISELLNANLKNESKFRLSENASYKFAFEAEFGEVISEGFKEDTLKKINQLESHLNTDVKRIENSITQIGEKTNKLDTRINENKSNIESAMNEIQKIEEITNTNSVNLLSKLTNLENDLETYRLKYQILRRNAIIAISGIGLLSAISILITLLVR